MKEGWTIRAWLLHILHDAPKSIEENRRPMMRESLGFYALSARKISLELEILAAGEFVNRDTNGWFTLTQPSHNPASGRDLD